METNTINMYKPKFRITNKMLRDISSISASREAILSAPILPRFEKRLREDALISRTHSSTSIEGNKLDKDDVKDLFYGKDITARKKDKLEVQNYLEVLKYIDGLNKITEKNLLKIHELTCKGILSKNECGSYRKKYVVVASEEGIKFRPPKNELVPRLMKDFVEFLNSDYALELNPVLLAGITHYYFVYIHPFIDGNGRTARALATLVLYLRGFDTKRIFALDDYYNENRDDYYNALDNAHTNNSEMTKWLEYFVEGVAVSMAKIKRRILRFSVDRKITKEKGQVYLNERQLKGLEYIQRNGRITNSEYVSLNRVSRNTASRDLMEMVEFKVVIQKGVGRGSYFEKM